MYSHTSNRPGDTTLEASSWRTSGFVVNHLQGRFTPLKSVYCIKSVFLVKTVLLVRSVLLQYIF
jgi:hypothetical protein